MTEEQFDMKVEAAAARFEQSVEQKAAHFDRSVTSSFRRHRKVFRLVQWVVAVCLLLCFWLVPGTAGTICGWLGVAGLVGAVVQGLIFR